ncbi:MAG: toll/interleukin-1 receptor domain-containing protein [Pseudomonadota bacterium]
MTYDVFLSYNRKSDSVLAQEVAQELESCGFSVFIDTESLPIGEDFGPIVDKCIHEAKCVLALLSNASVNSVWVQNEMRAGKRLNKLIPVAIDEILLPTEFDQTQYIDLHAEWSQRVPKGPIFSTKSWRRALELISANVNRPAVSAKFKYEHPALKILVLDDHPHEAKADIEDRMLSMLGDISASTESKLTQKIRGIENLNVLWAIGYGEVMRLEFTFNGSDKEALLNCLQSHAYLTEFDVILIDRMWDDAPYSLSADDFGLLGSSFDGEDNAGLLFLNMASHFSKRMPLIAMQSADLPTANVIQRAQKAGAALFIDKNHWTELCNILIVAIDKQKIRKDRAAGRKDITL